MILHVSFTGTRNGMTAEQRDAVADLLASMLRTYGEIVAHHGDCIGADADFHAICRTGRIPVHGHPPLQSSMRANCAFDLEHGPLSYMDRNYAMVQLADRVIACPAEPAERSRGGTWATVRMARRAGKRLAIIEPDGFVRVEAGR